MPGNDVARSTSKDRINIRFIKKNVWKIGIEFSEVEDVPQPEKSNKRQPPIGIETVKRIIGESSSHNICGLSEVKQPFTASLVVILAEETPKS